MPKSITVYFRRLSSILADRIFDGLNKSSISKNTTYLFGGLSSILAAKISDRQAHLEKEFDVNYRGSSSIFISNILRILYLFNCQKMTHTKSTTIIYN